jgi:Uma2 family endonuclease
MRQAQRHYSVEEYLSLEEGSSVRHEYFDGEIIAMSGGSARHNRITKNLVKLLDAAADRECEAFFTDMRVKTASSLYTYPDVFVVCGPLAYSAEDPLAVTNPILIADVRDYDRGQKFDLYRATKTLRDYLLVDQYAIDVEHRFLEGDRWRSNRYTSREDVVQLQGVDIALRVETIYERVEV